MQIGTVPDIITWLIKWYSLKGIYLETCSNSLIEKSSYIQHNPVCKMVMKQISMEKIAGTNVMIGFLSWR